MHYNGEISSAVPIIQYSPAGKIVFWVAKSFCSVDICGQYVKNKTKYIRNTVLFFIIFLGQDSCFFSGYLAKILYFHGIIAVILLGKVIKTHFFITKCKIIFITNSLNLKLHLFSLFLKILSSCTRFSPTFFKILPLVSTVTLFAVNFCFFLSSAYSLLFGLWAPSRDELGYRQRYVQYIDNRTVGTIYHQCC